MSCDRLEKMGTYETNPVLLTDKNWLDKLENTASDVCGLTYKEIRRSARILSREQLLELVSFGMYRYKELYDAAEALIKYSPASRRLMIRGLNYGTSDESFRNYFLQFGEIENAAIIRHPNGRSQGYGFLIYKDKNVTERVLETSHKLDNKQIMVKLAADSNNFWSGTNPDSRVPDKRKLFIRNISSEITDEMLGKEFSRYGPIGECAIIRLSDGSQKGYGFVTFENELDAWRAAQEPVRIINGWVLFVTFSKGRAKIDNQRNTDKEISGASNAGRTSTRLPSKNNQRKEYTEYQNNSFSVSPRRHNVAPECMSPCKYNVPNYNKELSALKNVGTLRKNQEGLYKQCFLPWLNSNQLSSHVRVDHEEQMYCHPDISWNAIQSIQQDFSLHPEALSLELLKSCSFRSSALGDTCGFIRQNPRESSGNNASSIEELNISGRMRNQNTNIDPFKNEYFGLRKEVDEQANLLELRQNGIIAQENFQMTRKSNSSRNAVCSQDALGRFMKEQSLGTVLHSAIQCHAYEDNNLQGSTRMGNNYGVTGIKTTDVSRGTPVVSKTAASVHFGHSISEKRGNSTDKQFRVKSKKNSVTESKLETSRLGYRKNYAASSKNFEPCLKNGYYGQVPSQFVEMGNSIEGHDTCLAGTAKSPSPDIQSNGDHISEEKSGTSMKRYSRRVSFEEVNKSQKFEYSNESRDYDKSNESVDSWSETKSLSLEPGSITFSDMDEKELINSILPGKSVDICNEIEEKEMKFKLASMDFSILPKKKVSFDYSTLKREKRRFSVPPKRFHQSSKHADFFDFNKTSNDDAGIRKFLGSRSSTMNSLASERMKGFDFKVLRNNSRSTFKTLDSVDMYSGGLEDDNESDETHHLEFQNLINDKSLRFDPESNKSIAVETYLSNNYSPYDAGNMVSSMANPVLLGMSWDAADCRTSKNPVELPFS